MHKKNQHLIVQIDIAIYMTIRRETEKMLLEHTLYVLTAFFRVKYMIYLIIFPFS